MHFTMTDLGSAVTGIGDNNFLILFLWCPTIAITCKITFPVYEKMFTFFLCESLQTQYFTFSLSRILKSIYISQISLDGFGLLSGLIVKIFLQPMCLGCQFNYAGRTHLRRTFAWDWLQVETCPSFTHYSSYVNTSTLLDMKYLEISYLCLISLNPASL